MIALRSSLSPAVIVTNIDGALMNAYVLYVNSYMSSAVRKDCIFVRNKTTDANAERKAQRRNCICVLYCR